MSNDEFNLYVLDVGFEPAQATAPAAWQWVTAFTGAIAPSLRPNNAHPQQILPFRVLAIVATSDGIGYNTRHEYA